MTTKLSDVTVLVKFESNLVNILQIIDYAKELYLDKEQYEEVKASLRAMFQEKGISDAHILSLICTEDESKYATLAKEDAFCWRIHSGTLELIIEEDKQPDFYGVKGLVETFLTEYRENPSRFEISADEPLKKLTTKEKAATFFKNAPYVSISIIVVNLILCFCCIENPTFFYGKGCVADEYILQGEWYRLITAMFLHASLDHYFSNMLLLFCLGNQMENKIGRVRFFVLYMLTGIMGNVLSCLYEFYASVERISYGASGAVSGMIGVLFYLVMHRYEGIKVSVPAMLVMVLYSVYSSVVGVNVNEMAHLGGLLSGMLLMLVFYPRRKSHES